MYAREVAWAAGLFEGEGCFTLCRQRNGSRIAVATVTSTDHDIVNKFHSVVGFGHVVRHEPPNPLHKVRYIWRTTGHEKVQAILAMFWNWLGERRRAKGAEVVTTCAKRRYVR